MMSPILTTPCIYANDFLYASVLIGRQSRGADAYYQKEEEFGKKRSLIEQGGSMLFLPALLLFCEAVCVWESVCVCECVWIRKNKSEKACIGVKKACIGVCNIQTLSQMWLWCNLYGICKYHNLNKLTD